MKKRWRAVLDHPLLRLELRRVHRRRWWPGRRFFLFYPALLGCALGYGVVAAWSSPLARRLAVLTTGVPGVCLLSVVSWLLTVGLTWIAPAFTAASIARERELGTLDLLRVTLLTERSLVLGKLGGCIVRLWPGLLTLALLTPFQLLMASSGGALISLGGMSGMWFEGGDAPLGVGIWLGVLLSSGIGLLESWSDIALHAAVGLFISALSRSTSVAIVASYSVILGLRAALYLANSLLSVALTMIPALLMSGALAAGTDEGLIGWVMMMPGIITSVGVVCIQVVGAVLLVYAAIWWLRRE